MRLSAIMLACLLLSPSAWAFDCAGAKLPSSIVICSDPELIRLADERQQAFNEARWGKSGTDLLDPSTTKNFGRTSAAGSVSTLPIAAYRPMPRPRRSLSRRACENVSSARHRVGSCFFAATASSWGRPKRQVAARRKRGSVQGSIAPTQSIRWHS